MRGCLAGSAPWAKLICLPVAVVAVAASAAEPGPGLPATRASGPLRVTFTRFQNGLSPRDLHSPARRGEKPWLRADFRAELKGSTTRSWLPERLRIRDAGNSSWTVEGTRVFYGPDGEGCFAFPQPVRAHPFPWHLSVELARATKFMPYELWGNFSHAELWTLPLIPVPKSGETRRTPAADRHTVRQGVRLSLAQASGWRVDLHGSSARPGVTRLVVRTSEIPPDTRLTLLRAVDFKGRLAPLVATSSSRHGDEWERVFGLQTRPGARVLNVTFALHRSRTVEFVARPGAAQP